MKKPSKKINLVPDALHGMAYYIFLKSLRSLEEFRRNPHVKILPKSPSTNFQSLGKFKNLIFNSELFSSPAAAHLLTPCPAQSAHRLLRLSDSAVACSACPIRPTLAPLLRFGCCLPLAHRWAHPVSEPGVVTFIGQCPRRHRSPTAERRPAPRLGCHRTVTTSPSFFLLKSPLKPSPVFNGVKAINAGVKLPGHPSPALPRPPIKGKHLHRVSPHLSPLLFPSLHA
jgi:hypothetical protein